MTDKSNRIELSVNVNYLPDWHLWQGVREIVQNARDAEIQTGGKMTVAHERLGLSGRLTVKNEGAELTREALLFGTTTKEEDDRTIGKFGEGLKLGVLALVRAGHVVKIRSGDETWTPVIEQSEKYNAKVLCFHCRKAGGRRDQVVVVEIEGVSKELWDQLRERFLFVDEPRDVVVTPRGRILQEGRHVGKVYVRGIYVADEKDLSLGYDLNYADLDRDRRMIRAWDMEWEIAQILRDAAVAHPDLLADTVYDMTSAGTTDVRRIGDLGGTTFPEMAARKFRERHGADAVPVSGEEDLKSLERVGRRGIIASEPLRAVLKHTVGSAAVVMERAKREVVQTHDVTEIPDDARANLAWACDLMLRTRVLDRGRVAVATFRTDETESLTENGKIMVAWRLLGDRWEILRALVREVSLMEPEPRALEDLWRDVCREVAA